MTPDRLAEIRERLHRYHVSAAATEDENGVLSESLDGVFEFQRHAAQDVSELLAERDRLADRLRWRVVGEDGLPEMRVRVMLAIDGKASAIWPQAYLDISDVWKSGAGGWRYPGPSDRWLPLPEITP